MKDALPSVFFQRPAVSMPHKEKMLSVPYASGSIDDCNLAKHKLIMSV